MLKFKYIKARRLGLNSKFLIILICSLCAAQNAWAYIDPSTGGMLVQLLLGGLAGALYFVKLYYATIKAKIKGLFNKTKKKD